MDDNWVFTEDDAGHEFIGIATLAAAPGYLKALEAADGCRMS